MKRAFTLALILLAAFLTVFIVVACKTTPPPPPPVEEPPPPPPPAPPPPPVAVPEPETDVSPPKVSVSYSPQRFSPDGDGEDDKLFVTINVESASEVTSWHIEIREPVPPYILFSEWMGEGMPPETLEWDGLSANGELVQSASAYNFGLMVSNLYDYTIYQGTFETDILVQRDGDVLRAIVPSIVFAPNSGEFLRGVSTDTVENNEYILRRVAEVLNKPEYSTLRVKVEGHANPTTPPNTAARTTEERGTRSEIGLQPLSEQRAKAVVDYLATHGVDPARLSFVGAGGTRTVVAFEDRDNWWKNRRVEFILESR